MKEIDVKAKTISLDFEPLILKTKHPFGISYGTSSDTHNTLVRLSWKGHVGFGEASATSYHDETPQTVDALLKAWSESNILGDDPFEIEAVTRRLDKSVSGNRSAKAAVEMALHDLVGKILSKPLIDIFGLKGIQPPITDFTIGIDNLDMVAKKTEEAIADGYKHLKVKQGTDNDKEIIRTIRKVAGDIPIRVDANGAWDAKKAIEMSRFLAEEGVEFIEQPLSKYASKEEWRFTRERTHIPIYADESVCTSGDLAKLAGCVDGVVVKLMKTGGLKEAMRVIHLARAQGVKVMIGCMIESSVGIAAACQIAPLADHLDLDGALLLANDPFDGPFYEDGYLKLKDLPGLGVVERA